MNGVHESVAVIVPSNSKRARFILRSARGGCEQVFCVPR
jgi:hypothetical protein